jgi:hypothetical protein
MWLSRTIVAVTVSLVCSVAGAQPRATSAPTPFGDLQSQIDELVGRIHVLEQSAADQSVDGRTYCMMVNVTILRGFSSSAMETVDTIVVRRVLHFSGGAFMATLVDSSRNSQTDDGVVAFIQGVSPELLDGTYTQSASQLDLLFSDATTATWYVSRDGSVIHSNGIDFFGPFPNSLTLGIVRSATAIESDTCEID